MRGPVRFLTAVALVVSCHGWHRGVAAQENAAPMTNADVVRMVSAGLTDGVIVRAIRTSAVTRFETGPDALVELRARKVSNQVIAAMLDRQTRSGSPGARAPRQLSPRGRWEVEVHGGGAFGSHPTDGAGSLPPAGPSFITSTFSTSRRASSWYFGDGAALLNAINATFGTGTFSAPGRIVPLDPVLKQSGASWGNGGSFGARVAYDFTPRFSAEFTVDAPLGQLKLTDTLLAGVEASRASFTAAWNEQTGLIRSGGGFIFTNPSVTSVATINDKQGRQVFTTGALTVNFPTQHRLVPYATIGAGVISNTGATPSVTLTGNYRFTSLNAFFGSPFSPTFPVNETDTVSIRFASASAHPFVTVFGGGVKLLGSSRWGVRADVRAYVSQNTVDVLVDANPQIAVGTPAGFIASTPTPSIQFSNNPSTNQPSTLSGAPISGFKTFSSSGTAIQMSVSIGYFVRF